MVAVCNQRCAAADPHRPQETSVLTTDLTTPSGQIGVHGIVEEQAGFFGHLGQSAATGMRSFCFLLFLFSDAVLTFAFGSIDGTNPAVWLKNFHLADCLFSHFYYPHPFINRLTIHSRSL